MKFDKKFMIMVTYASIVISSMFILGASSCDVRGNGDSPVIMLGDSIFDLSEEATQALEALAGEQYRYRYQNGAGILRENNLLWPDTIPTQYGIERELNPEITTAIMTGGANDASGTYTISCRADSIPELSAACIDFLDDTADVFEALLAEMNGDSVENIILFEQYNFVTPRNPLSIYGDWTDANAALDYLVPQLEAACNAVANCHFIDSKEVFAANPDQYLKPDGIHPSADGSQVIADLIFAKMCEEDIEINTATAVANCN